MLLAALATILVVEVYSACPLSRPCPCGSSGKSYMRCFKTTVQQYSCESWANCQTCEDYNEFCVTCPPGRSGQTCKNESTLTYKSFCQPPKTIRNGFIQNGGPKMKKFPLNIVLTFKCMEGYELIGPTIIKCLPNGDKLGYWSDLPPRCKYVPTTTRRKRDIKEQQEYTSTGTDKGCTFQITGNNSFYCTTNMKGKVTCDVACNDKGQGRYHCFPGIGWDRTIPTCEAPKEPNGLPMKEKEVTCSDPGTPPNGGRRNLDGNDIPSQYTFKEGDVVVFFCNDRKATLQGSFVLTCKPDATWDRNLPVCISSQKEVKVKPIVSCKNPGVVENGIVEDFQSETEQFPVGAKLGFLCREGFERVGPESIYCLLNLSWSEEPPVCKPVPTVTVSTPTPESSCERPRTIENGFIQNIEPEMQSFTLNTVLSYKCMEGYELVGATTIQCLCTADQHGYWSDPPPRCRSILTTTTSHTTKEVFCPNPGMVENGIFENYPPETISFPIGTALKFQCIEGFEMEGSHYIYCILPGKWSGSLPNCRFIPTTPVSDSGVFCNHPGMVANGTFEEMSQSRFPVGMTLTFRCRPGTRIEGEKNIYCLLNGQWSSAKPICRPTRKEPERGFRLTCNHPGIIVNGVSEPNVSMSEVFSPGKQLKFKCNEGYTIAGSDTVYCESSGKWSSTPPVCSRSKKTPDCGRVFQEVYKTTGKHTRSDWPWTVGLSTGSEDDVEKVFCGGALLNSKTVITAAHCVTSSHNIKLHFDYRRPVTEQVRNISRIIMHPDYDDETHSNDIALLKLDRNVYYDQRTQPICLPTTDLNVSSKNLLPGTTTVVAGYRLEFAKSQSPAPAFKVFELPVQSQEVCEPVCRDQELVSCSPSTFCAGYLKDTKECIYGGTPLVVYNKEKSRYTLEGLVTRAVSASNIWDGRCKRAESYTTFTNVTHFMPFISENMD